MVEEPGNKTSFVFIADKARDLLPTLVSRCQTIVFEGLKEYYNISVELELMFSELLRNAFQIKKNVSYGSKIIEWSKTAARLDRENQKDFFIYSTEIIRQAFLKNIQADKLVTFSPKTKFYFAGSSEMFGKVREIPQTEKTPFYPRSVYGISKVAGFDLTRLGRAPARFDPAELQRLNVKLLQSLPYEKVADRLLSLGIQCDDMQTGALFWETVRGNIDKLEDALALWQIIQGPVESVIDVGDSAYLETALDCLPDEPWDETSWSQWTTELKQSTGRKGKELFMPLRKALTGQSHGPEMQNLLLLIGPTHVKNRLKG